MLRIRHRIEPRSDAGTFQAGLLERTLGQWRMFASEVPEVWPRLVPAIATDHNWPTRQLDLTPENAGDSASSMTPLIRGLSVRVPRAHQVAGQPGFDRERTALGRLTVKVEPPMCSETTEISPP